MEIMENIDITKELFNLQDEQYRNMQIKIIPNIDAERIIGVRTPLLRAFAKDLVKKSKSSLDISRTTTDFLEKLPHEYFDENQLHAFIICEEKDFEKCMNRIERFLPYIDNWATCDQLSPKIFRKQENRKALLPYIDKWIKSPHCYTIRFAIGLLLQHFLDEEFKEEYLDKAASVRSDEYYVKMMVAWYFATALAKQYDAALPFIEEKRLEKWTHNKAIQKAIESYRVTPEHKEYLRSLKNL